MFGNFRAVPQDKNLAPGVDLTAIARQTPGMSGADLANLLNEGAIRNFENSTQGKGLQGGGVLGGSSPLDVSGDHNQW